MSAEAVDDTLADLLAEDGIGGDTFFFDETFNLLYALLVYAECVGRVDHHPQCPKSS